MTTILRRALAAPIAVSCALLLLAGCAAEPADAPPAAPVDDVATVEDDTSDAALPSQGDVTMVMAGQSFTFSATTCAISETDILVMGPGVDDESSDPAYLDIDLTDVDNTKQGEVRVELGTDEPFTTTDEFYMAPIGPDHEYGIMYDGDGFILEAAFLASGGSPIGPATVTVRCS